MRYNESKKNFVAKKTILLEEGFEDMYNDIMLNIYKAMRDKGLSFSELSHITGVSESHLYRVLRSNSQVRFDTFCKIIIALGIEPQKVFPKSMKNQQDRTEYGERFEYIIKGLEEIDKEFLLRWSEQYAACQEQKKGKREMETMPHGMDDSEGRLHATPDNA